MTKKTKLVNLIVTSHAIIFTLGYLYAVIFPVSSDEPVSFITRANQIALIVLGSGSATGLLMNKKWGQLTGIVFYSLLLFQSSRLVIIAFRINGMSVETSASVLFVLLLCFPLALLIVKKKH